LSKPNNIVSKVWLVFHSDYECANLKGVFASKELADLFIDEQIRMPDNEYKDTALAHIWTDRQFWGVQEEIVQNKEVKS